MKRALSIFLTCVFLLGLLPTAALAAEEYSGGLCPHHQEHSFEDCGYMEAIVGQPCGHIHGGDCGYVEAAEEIPCDMDCNETGEDSQIIHGEGCAYAPEVEGVPCQHEHDDECGYVPAAPGQPCGYVCLICPVEAKIDALPTAEDITTENRDEVEAQLEAIDEAQADGSTVTLNIADGNIVITNTGYSVGGAAETAYTWNYTLTGTASMKTVTIKGGTHTITLNELNMTNTSDGGTFGLQLESRANVTLVIDGMNTIKAGGSGGDSVPIFVRENASLTIRSVDGTNNHTLNAIGTTDGKAAIGGSWDYPSGSITIQSGTINAKGGGNKASVIGKGGDDNSYYDPSDAPVTITGGVINCTAINKNDGVYFLYGKV